MKAKALLILALIILAVIEYKLWSGPYWSDQEPSFPPLPNDRRAGNSLHRPSSAALP
jgi:hypothetical protein